MDIKFRGFRKDGKGWVEGYYGRDCLGGHVITVYENDFASISHYDVFPESLGITFGMPDKHGKAIFAAIGKFGGDIIECPFEKAEGLLFNFPHRKYEFGTTKDAVILKDGCFCVEAEMPKKETVLLSQFNSVCEITGNQYEQPQQ